MGATVEHVLEGNGKDVGLLGAREVRDVGIQRNPLLSSSGLCDGHADTEDGIGTELLLVLGSIELVEELIDGGLVLDVDLLLDEGRCDDVVDVGNGLGNTLTTPLGCDLNQRMSSELSKTGPRQAYRSSCDVTWELRKPGHVTVSWVRLTLVAIAELASLVRASGGTGRHDCAVQTGLANEVDLDGRVTARVVHGTGVDLGDGHVDYAGGGQLRVERSNWSENELGGS